MELYFITYCTESHKKIATNLIKKAEASNQFDFCRLYTRDELEKTKFYLSNKFILDQPKYAGACLWKPHFIIHALDQAKEGDVVMYIDACDDLQNLDTLRAFVMERMKGEDVLLTSGAFRNFEYTKMDAFVLMDCESQEYTNDIQIEAGIILVRKTVRSMFLMREWLKYCRDERIILDTPNVMGRENSLFFKDHRADQSILSLLAVKRSINRTDEFRHYVTCNAFTVSQEEQNFFGRAIAKVKNMF